MNVRPVDRQRTIGCALAVTLTLACGGSSDRPGMDVTRSDHSAADALRMTRCEVKDLDGDARCGWYTVWENRETHQGRRIALKVIVLPARDAAAREPDPIFVLTGGPGIGAATEASTANLLRAARDVRDVVLVDQRGTGASAPLTCDLYGRGFAPYLGDRFPAAAVHRCRDSLARHADLTQYTSSIAADDLDDVRAALGYERIDLAGFSYGSKLALVYLRQHPSRVRRAVLDGVLTTAYPTPLPAAEAGARALRAVFADCAAQPRCARAYPRLEAEFHAVSARLDSAPTPVTLTEDFGLGREHALLTRRAFLNGLWAHLYTARDAREIPRMIHRAAEGDFTFAARQIDMFNVKRWPRFNVGAMLSILCTEDVPYIAQTDLARADSIGLLGAPHARELREACDGWPRGMMPPGYRDPVRSDVPTLILSGALDPITPPAWAASAARSLARSTLVVRSGAGHLDEDDCTLGLLADFMTRRNPEGMDVTCAERSRREEFWVK
jgi:pimeloyl-ACP methyl ester carboxylesterase